MPFVDAENNHAYLKMGLMGLQGSGKTRTAVEVAIGLHQMLAKLGLPGGDKPVYFFDTETGSDWHAPTFRKHGIRLKVSKSRAFTDLIGGLYEVADNNAIAIIDSITHFWKEIVQAYIEKKRRTRLSFDDWPVIKGPGMWQDFTDLYVNSPCHLIMCGRQGYEYDFFEDESGRKQLEKTAIKMKAESETGYEPDLLVVMERHQQLDRRGGIERVWRTAYILKDRSDTIDGKSFENPTFETFLPHIQGLNLGGEQLGVDTTRTSTSIVPAGETDWKYEEQQRGILLEEIEQLIKKHHPSQSADDKQARIELIEEFFGTRSWKKVETFGVNELKHAYNRLHNKLEMRPAYPELPLEDGALPPAQSDAPF